MTKPVVSLAKLASYESSNCRSALSAVLEPSGGLTAHVKSGERVLIKPNLLSPHKPSDAVCTHPELLLTLCDMVSEIGAKPSVGDSPALVSARKVLTQLGVLEELEKRGVEVLEFEEITPISGSTFRSLEVATEVLQADKVINFCKLKTHGMMVLTCAVKNLYGCIVGKRKAAYHLHVRESRELFARLMMDLAQIVSPVLNIVDGVEAMEGNGPGSGEPRKMNFIAASEEAWALDLLCAWLTGFSADEVPILKEYAKDAARQKQLLDIDVVGHDWRELMAEDFKRAKSFSLSFRIPAILRRPLNRLVLPRPHVNSDKCVACGDCAESCPANVIKVTRKAKIKLGGCIRCFCCQEVCPVKAIDIRHPLLSFLRK